MGEEREGRGQWRREGGKGEIKFKMFRRNNIDD